MHIQHDSLQSWAHAVRSGQVRLAPGQQLTHQQLAALHGYGNTELSANTAHGAPGSRMALDAAESHRKTIAAAAALQRQADLQAAHAVPGDTVARLARKLQQTPGFRQAWHRAEERWLQHRLGDRPSTPEEGIRQKLDQLSLRQIQAARQPQSEDKEWREAQERMRREGRTLVTGQPAPSYAQRIERQFREAEHGPAQDGTARALATLQKMLERLIEKLERYMSESPDPAERLAFYAHRQRRAA